jgi:ubiquinone/menaquinone biosynthesis C-methylase UbiE
MSATSTMRETNPASLQEATLQPAAVLTQMISGYMVSQAIHVAAKLGVADLMTAGKARSVEELARETGAHAPSLRRFMRALCGAGVFAEREDGLFELTPVGELLRSDVPGSQRDMAIYMGEEWHMRVWSGAFHSAQTGKTAHEHIYGKEVFPYFAANPEVAAVFDRAMTGMSAMVAPAVVESYDFSSVKRIVDVAGGHGKMLSAILKANPHVSGTLFDVASVIEGAGDKLDAEGVSRRCELAIGDFFEGVPAGADAYLLKHIIHDWEDERALAILRNCHRAMRDDGRLLVVEMVIAPDNQPHFGKLVDLEMLLFTGGCERTEAEYRELFAKAGFELTRVIPTPSPYSIVEAVKAGTRYMY